MKYISISGLLRKKLSFFHYVIFITIIILKMSVTFNEDVIVKTIGTICPNGTNCHDKNCKKEHSQDTLYYEKLNSEKKKEVKLLKSTKKQCPNGEKCKKSECPYAHPWDTVYRA